MRLKTLNALWPDKKVRPVSQLSATERINFLLTNRIPRRLATQFIGWFSRIESSRLTRFSIFIWSLFSDDLKLEEANKSKFSSLRECFIRQLKVGMRPVDSRKEIMVSPCDAIVGACGRVEDGTLYQTKGFPYQLSELIPDPRLANKYRNGTFVTLRLKSSMYHRFHAPTDCRIEQVQYISGDTWNVNPVALKCIERLYCRNERAVVELKLANAEKSLTLVPVAAILVASMKFHCIETDLDLNYRGANIISCQTSLGKGEEIGFFQHGSTIIVFASENFKLCDGIHDGMAIQMGQPLLIDTNISLENQS